MPLMIFNFILPAVIGYTLFLGISGQFSPFAKPEEPRRRPNWFLGLWTGASVMLALILAMNIADYLTSASLSSILTPSATLLGLLLLPGFAGYLWYRSLSQRAIPTEAEPAFQQDTDLIVDTQAIVHPDSHVIGEEYDRAFAIAHNAAQLSVVESSSISLLNVSDDYDQAFCIAQFSTISSLHSSHQEEQLALEIEQPQDHSSNPGMTDLLRTELALQKAQADELMEAKLLEREEILRAELTESTRHEVEEKIQDLEKTIQESKRIADEEFDLRVQTEKHLRITRKALTLLEERTRNTESEKTDDLIELELQLEENIKATSIAEAAAARSEESRAQIEKELFLSKQAVLTARKDARKSTAARAKVLATANKAVAFARHSVDARAVAESELTRLTDHINSQQTTISSLINKLEAEKAKSREEVSYLAKQLLLREKELETQTAIAQSASGNITTRLVKKVARARQPV